MKLKKFVLREGMNELHASELKVLRGGTDGLTAACQCICHDVEFGTSHVNAEWTTYTLTGDCSSSQIMSMIDKYCYSAGTCTDIK